MKKAGGKLPQGPARGLRRVVLPRRQAPPALGVVAGAVSSSLGGRRPSERLASSQAAAGGLPFWRGRPPAPAAALLLSTLRSATAARTHAAAGHVSAWRLGGFCVQDIRAHCCLRVARALAARRPTESGAPSRRPRRRRRRRRRQWPTGLQRSGVYRRSRTFPLQESTGFGSSRPISSSFTVRGRLVVEEGRHRPVGGCKMMRVHVAASELRVLV